MHIGSVPDNLLESIALRANLVPDPLVKTQVAFILARSVMAAVELRIFDALVEGARTCEEVARACSSQERPTRSLLNALVSCEYLTLDPRTRRYALTAVSRKWLTRSSRHSLCDKMLFQNFEWDFLNGLFDYVKDGKSVNLHQPGRPGLWEAYQRGMADMGKLALPEIVKKAPIPRSARRMLDIGGSGGAYSAAFIKSRPGLRSEILDLPDAVEHARELVRRHDLPSDVLSIRAGNALEDDFGTDRYDFVLMANLAHHFTESQHSGLAVKIRNALTPHGVYCILENERTECPSKEGQLGALMDLFFGLTSSVGTWSCAEMSAWLSAAGLQLGKTIRLRTAPGCLMIHGRK